MIEEISGKIKLQWNVLNKDLFDIKRYKISVENDEKEINEWPGKLFNFLEYKIRFI